ncbi:MAG TPA: urea carboxylase [Steroidobacteraceae bacterium]|nr:urea carboxylase [Steroidobacteraceae bacterium]
MLEKILIANRGAIACRILRTLRRLGIESVAVFSQSDAGSLHVAQADEAVCIGPPPAAASYLNAAALIAAARERGAQAIHPGYGFLSENADFAAQCEDAGILFIGPTPQNIRAFGLKHHAREIAQAQSVALVPGSGLLDDLQAARAAARRIGFPVMLKATGGGGGIGMRACEDMKALEAAFAGVSRLAATHFADGGIYLERLVSDARHVEVQVFGDGNGRVVALGERDCSLQRRHQKVIEEAPAPQLGAQLRAALAASAIKLARAVSYRSAGTVEFLLDPARGEFYFLEVNTRLQVEHAVTEEITGVDLIEWMVRGAGGDYSFMDAWTDRSAPRHPPAGWSIQARLYAEDPGEDNRPSSGTLTQVEWPQDVRVETWVDSGTEVGTHYDPLLAKIIVTGADRPAAVAALQRALEGTRMAGLETNLQWLRQIAASEMFVCGRVTTQALATVPYAAHGVRVLSGGLATSIQDYPGRCGYWHVGVPPSGPMDSLAFRLGNRLLGNPEGAAGLEVTAIGPALLFGSATAICLTGADSGAHLDGVAVETYRVTPIAAGQTLRLGRISGPGLRAYVLFAGGIEVPAYLGSRSTFILGRFGGHAGRNLASGDVLRLQGQPPAPRVAQLAPQQQPSLTRSWRLRVLYGPHGAPDFFTDADIDSILSAQWRVHYNSNRTGVRLIGPKPEWARRDGGEAGLHPSNIHDNAYAIGALDFTGDMPIILGPDGPSLGGFVCPFVVISADLWKLGQFAPGDGVEFECVDESVARTAVQLQNAWIGAAPGAIGNPTQSTSGGTRRHPEGSAVVAALEAKGSRPRTLYRRQGDNHLLVEYGPIVLDLTLRLRVHALMLEFQRLQPAGIVDVTPGIRSLQFHFDPDVLSLDALLRLLVDCEERLGGLEDFEIPSRVVWLPLSFADPAVGETVQRYMTSVRADAPWCPDNIEFIRRINGLTSAEEVREIVFAARYMVLGLGDVYLGAPVAVPLDPRHRLVTTKYNPARTWTPPNVVGIGGAYLCIYGMEGPGGYQLFGRTVQVWNSYRRSGEFREFPWLLRFFDQIRFFPVTHAELEEWRRDFPVGRRSLRIETETFRLADYQRLLRDQASGIDAFQRTRGVAFDAEREAWIRRNELSVEAAPADSHAASAAPTAPPGSELIEAPLGGHIWRIPVRPGDRIEKGSVIAAIEAMKTECSVPSPAAGIVRAVYIQERQAVTPGMALIALEPLPTTRSAEGTSYG